MFIGSLLKTIVIFLNNTRRRENELDKSAPTVIFMMAVNVPECPYCLQGKNGCKNCRNDGDPRRKKEGMEKAAERMVIHILFSMQDDYSQNLLAKKFYEKIIGVQPVVGWLVCTQGEYFGESFKLVSGKNFIGPLQTWISY